MNTVLEWAEYFRANPDHLMSYVVDALGCHVFRHDESLMQVGPVLGRFKDMREAQSVMNAARKLAAQAPAETGIECGHDLECALHARAR